MALVKTARVIYLFRKVSPTKRASQTYTILGILLQHIYSLQKVKDWHLLLLSTGILMIEIVYVIPLLVLNYVKGEARFETDSENPSVKNASELL